MFLFMLMFSVINAQGHARGPPPQAPKPVAAFDFDGTLFTQTQTNGAGIVLTPVINVLTRYAQSGWNIVIVTGRSPSDNPMILKFLQDHHISQYVSQHIYNTPANSKTAAVQQTGARVLFDDDSNVLREAKAAFPHLQVYLVSGTTGQITELSSPATPKRVS